MKAQLLVSQESKMIYGVVSGKGKTHDFNMFKESKTRITPDVKILGDSGYQGIKDIHTNSHIHQLKNLRARRQPKNAL